jgi:ubiquinone/menaquinone biosynthesis C-methylase UbiE
MGIVYHLGGKVYDFLDEHFEKTRYFKIRKNILKDLNGQILDAGCGTGRNFPHYNPNAKVTGIDISPKMLEVAKQRATKGKANIKVLEGHKIQRQYFQ